MTRAPSTTVRVPHAAAALDDPVVAFKAMDQIDDLLLAYCMELSGWPRTDHRRAETGRGQRTTGHWAMTTGETWMETFAIPRQQLRPDEAAEFLTDVTGSRAPSQRFLSE